MGDEQEETGKRAQDSAEDTTANANHGQGRYKSMGDGIKEGLGVLSAFKDALEETIQEARERGDLSTDRAKEVMKDTLGKAQTAAEGARDRLDFASQADLERVKDAVDAMKVRLDALEASVFGASNGSDETGEGDAASADP
jgi:polyhydroxyalkanoate synthesis regulator phasin